MKIAIYGPMCSGKSTIANIIQKKYPQYKIYSFGQKIKDIANELFNMEGKNRSLLINIADKMRDIDEDVWVKYIMKQINDLNSLYCQILATWRNGYAEDCKSFYSSSILDVASI